MHNMRKKNETVVSKVKTFDSSQFNIEKTAV